MGERVSFFRLDGGAQAAPAAATRAAIPTRSHTDSITMRKRYA
jgi:hypothetical protein